MGCFGSVDSHLPLRLVQPAGDAGEISPEVEAPGVLDSILCQLQPTTTEFIGNLGKFFAQMIKKRSKCRENSFFSGIPGQGRFRVRFRRRKSSIFECVPGPKMILTNF